MALVHLGARIWFPVDVLLVAEQMIGSTTMDTIYMCTCACVYTCVFISLSFFLYVSPGYYAMGSAGKMLVDASIIVSQVGKACYVLANICTHTFFLFHISQVSLVHTLSLYQKTYIASILLYQSK